MGVYGHEVAPYRFNVSAVKQFYQCRFRWWAQFVMNRVPLVTPAALDGGKILHRAFERFEKTDGLSLADALASECKEFRDKIPNEHPAARSTLEKAVVTFEDVIEAMHLWRDRFPVDAVLEVEKAHEWRDPEMPNVSWLLRPDKVVVIGGRIWHAQRRGLAASKNFATYVRLQNRSYHEHLYMEVLAEKYCTRKTKLMPGGTVFDLLRKLKYRTNVGKKNEATKTAEDMFYQQAMVVNLKGPLHESVMMSLRQHAQDMIDATRRWQDEGIIPAPNEDQNGGYSGSSEDPYFKVLIGETTLDDNEVFKDREDQYAERTEE
jgi:hypothetical protein